MRLGFLIALFCVSGCLDHDLPEDTSDRQSFIALQRDFEEFRSWPSFDLGQRSHAGIEGRLVVYYRRLPPPGLKKFPVGTMLVKTVEAGTMSTWSVHAMVKRGGDFNQGGAFGWEFFDLRLNEDEVPIILWRGEKPPSDHGYETLPGLEGGTSVECNSCHVSATNDAVLTADLDLDRL